MGNENEDKEYTKEELLIASEAAGGYTWKSNYIAMQIHEYIKKKGNYMEEVKHAKETNN